MAKTRGGTGTVARVKKAAKKAVKAVKKAVKPAAKAMGVGGRKKTAGKKK